MPRFRNRNFGTDRKNSNKIDEDLEIFPYFFFSFEISIDSIRIFPIGTRAYNFKIFGKLRLGSVEISITFVLFRIDSWESRGSVVSRSTSISPKFFRARNFETSHIFKIFTYEQRILNFSFY